MHLFDQLAIDSPDNLVYGRAPKPVTTRRGVVLGGGTVYPELNFTVPPMPVDETTISEIRDMYRAIVDEACGRAVALDCEALVVELETLIEMTITPRYAIELTETINEVLDSWQSRTGLKSALRVTPNDTREMKRPPYLRSGKFLDRMLETFEGCARAGGELLSIESTGGKEIHDDALIACDIGAVIFALGIMGPRDMAFLWKHIVDIAASNGTVAAGDTACGFANTAMVLAEKKMIPRVFAAVVRAASAARSLVAYEQGAVGPGKDCGYENIYLKAITGCPMSMEGAVAACAHLSPLGNVAAAACDLWSNESVQNVKLLGGRAPTVFLEQLIYDCRLMNTARASGVDRAYRDLLVASDSSLDPQAYVLAPANAIRIAAAAVSQGSHYAACKAAAAETLSLIKEGHEAGAVRIPEMELTYLDMLTAAVGSLPGNQDRFIEQMLAQSDMTKFRPEEYALRAA
ncbi:MAG: methanol--corrinoid methyltransferase [Chitinivibrionales bacterium]|nr:methanol--corrinoid methyltransferase [Chitinivibrionales bacterium]MBD3396046.1 methanol--corrinoid methyltransferase [Chitinivibrionales bacterium]